MILFVAVSKVNEPVAVPPSLNATLSSVKTTVSALEPPIGATNSIAVARVEHVIR